MKNKILFSLILPLSAVVSTSVMAELTKVDLAQEIAQCYVAHEREQTHMYTSGEAEKMKVMLSSLVGDENADQQIIIANTQRN